MRARVAVGVLLVVAGVLAAPLAQESATLSSVDLSLSVFDQKNAGKADTSKNYVIFAYDANSCNGDNKGKCEDLEKALAEVSKDSGNVLSKYKSSIMFGKANKDDFPDHKKDLENAKVPLPAVLFWPAGHSRPSCKFDTPKATAEQMSQWLSAKLREEDDDSLLQLDEGNTDAPAPAPAALDDVSLLVCAADKSDLASHPTEEASCGDLMNNTPQNLVQVGKTEKIWDFSKADTKFIGPADNSLPHEANTALASTVRDVDAAAYQQLTKQGKWLALYFQAPWCHYCSCLSPVWEGVSSNLVSSHRQPDLVVGKVDGDAAPELRSLLNVTVYPTFLLINKEGNKVLGRYLGPRKVFELSTWVEDLIVAAENPIVKHQFEPSEQGAHVDLNPVFPYSGPEAFGHDAKLASQSLAAISSTATLMGNEFDECLESDEAKFTAPGAALLVHYSSDKHSFEMDASVVSTTKVPEKLTVVDFYASWCPHCQKLNPVWDQLSTDLANSNVVVGKVEMETHPDVKKQFGIHRFPTIMFFEAGKPMAYNEAHRYTGQRDLEHLKQWIQGLPH